MLRREKALDTPFRIITRHYLCSNRGVKVQFFQFPPSPPSLNWKLGASNAIFARQKIGRPVRDEGGSFRKLRVPFSNLEQTPRNRQS